MLAGKPILTRWQWPAGWFILVAAKERRGSQYRIPKSASPVVPNLSHTAMVYRQEEQAEQVC